MSDMGNSRTIVRHAEKIWEIDGACLQADNLLQSLKSYFWQPYTNLNGGSTIVGNSAYVSSEDKEHEEILDVFRDSLQDYISELSLSISVDHIDLGGIPIREYCEGSEMSSHNDGYGFVSENGVNVKPYITLLLYFNDNYQGGEIYFPDHSVSIKPKAGSVVIFPSNFNHGVKLVSSGSRYLTSVYVYEKPFSSYEITPYVVKESE
jgi:hypothetical protein